MNNYVVGFNPATAGKRTDQTEGNMVLDISRSHKGVLLAIRRRRRSTLALAFATTSMVLPAVCWAQASALVGAAASPAPPVSSGQVEEVIITAQRQAENLQSVPVSVSVVTAASVAKMGVRGTEDIALVAPAVNFVQSGSGANITIRGVGGSGSSADESGNAVYVDGVYEASTPGLIFSLNNISQIEVDKGPQGTLFGRNSVGGVIQITTRDPKYEFSSDGSITYGNYDYTAEQFYITGGLTKTLAADLAISNDNQGDGWGRNIYNGKATYTGGSLSARSKLKWEPDDNTSVTLILSHSDTTPPSGQGGAIVPGELTKGIGGVAGAGNPGFYNTDSNAENAKEVTANEISLTTRHTFPNFRVVNIVSRDTTTLHQEADADFGPANVLQYDLRAPVNDTTEELQLLTPKGSVIKGTLGFFYINESIALTPTYFTGLSLGSPTAFERNNATAYTNSWSVYGQSTVPLPFQTNFTGGLRYTDEDRRMNATPMTPAGVTSQINASASDQAVTWRLALDHQFTDAIMGYISDNRGFHSGLFNVSTPTNPPVKPELLDAYEIGLKTELWDKRIRLNMATFYYNFTNIQVREITASGTSILYNAAKAQEEGVDIDFTFKPIEHLTFQGGASYLNSHYTDFKSTPFFSVNPVGGLLQFAGDATGKATVFSPTWVSTINASYDVPVPVGYLNLDVTASYNSGFYFDPQNRTSQAAYTLVNSAITYTFPRRNIDIRLWGRNLTGVQYVTFISPSTSGDEYYPGAPRTFGITFGYHFG